MTPEHAEQNARRLEASKLGYVLSRNNVGVAMRDGVPVRYGLFNETKQMNQNWKSSDLIGLRPIIITPTMVGCTIGQFVALEIKRSSWKFSPSNKREVAQLKFINFVQSIGGYAKFVNREGMI